MRICLIFYIVVSFSYGAKSQNMSNIIIEEVLSEMADSISGQPGMWEFYVEGIPMLCITDENHNRMRVISPVSELENLKKGQLKLSMEANFHSVLDVKYAISDDIIWSVFIHPLMELSKEQLKDAVTQVWSATKTFGTTYSSTHLVFPGATENNGKKM